MPVRSDFNLSKFTGVDKTTTKFYGTGVYDGKKAVVMK